MINFNKSTPNSFSQSLCIITILIIIFLSSGCKGFFNFSDGVKVYSDQGTWYEGYQNTPDQPFYNYLWGHNSKQQYRLFPVDHRLFNHYLQRVSFGEVLYSNIYPNPNYYDDKDSVSWFQPDLNIDTNDDLVQYGIGIKPLNAFLRSRKDKSSIEVIFNAARQEVPLLNSAKYRYSLNQLDLAICYCSTPKAIEYNEFTLKIYLNNPWREEFYLNCGSGFCRCCTNSTSPSQYNLLELNSNIKPLYKRIPIIANNISLSNRYIHSCNCADIGRPL